MLSILASYTTRMASRSTFTLPKVSTSSQTWSKAMWIHAIIISTECTTLSLEISSVSTLTTGIRTRWSLALSNATAPVWEIPDSTVYTRGSWCTSSGSNTRFLCFAFFDSHPRNCRNALNGLNAFTQLGLSVSRRYKKYVPYYTQNELIFPGVKFESVNVDKLSTYFDTCDTFINNALSVESCKEGMKLRVKARHYCLNYKPFTYRFNINSDKETKAVLKIFLGPAYGDEKDISYLREYYKYFIEMDKFVVTRKSYSNRV